MGAGKAGKSHRLNPALVVNTELTKLVASLRELDTTPFGAELKPLASQDLVDSVVVHRATSKYLPPVEGIDEILHRAAIIEMIEHDERGFSFSPFKQGPSERKISYCAKDTLSKLFAGFRPSYGFRPPSGESALSNKGLTDVYYKLEDTLHWEVSVGAMPYAAAICYNNLWLKRVVKKHFLTQEPTGVDAIKQKRQWYLEWAEGPRECACGFFVFKKMFSSLCSISSVSRITTIPKNAKKRRVISMVPFWNMVCQLSLMGDMRNVLRNRLGFNLERVADLHKTLIRHRRNATIDLSRASDSIWRDVVEFHFPRSLTKWFDRLVDSHYEYDLGDDAGPQYGMFNMFAPMGCGLTFDVMTLLLLSSARVLDPGASVFGDDIIIKADEASRFMNFIESIGLIVNEDKTFIDGSISESCGGFYDHQGSRDIVCFDFTYCNNAVEALATANKLFRILEAHQVSSSVAMVLSETHQRILAKLRRYAVPSSYYQSGIPSDVLLTDDYEAWRQPNKVVELVSQYYHRIVHAVPSRAIVYDTNPPKEGMALYASYFYRYRSYEPNGSKDREVVTMIDAFSGTPLARIPLVSIL